ncbi:MAG TPA: TlpA disulfide reductase family protein, partial [Terrimicrobiaceae bacterium]
LEVKVTTDDNKILFAPAPGTSLTASEAKQISREIRRFLRTQFEPMTVDLEGNFPFRQFKALEAGNIQAIALPLNLSKGAHIPAFADFPGLFLAANDDFAVALSSFYLKSLLQPVLNTLDDFSKTYKVKDVVFGATLFVVHVWVSHATLNFQAGAILLIVNANVHITSNVPLVDDEDYDLTIQQKLGLTLDVLKQKFSLETIGDLSLSGSLPTEYKNKARNDLEQMRDNALEDAQGLVQAALKKVKFDDGLKPFDGSAKSKYTSVEIQPSGVVLRGTFTASQRPSVVVDVAETPDGKALPAFKSWIPAGTVEKYVWSWVSQDSSKPAVPWSGTEHEVSSQHRFIFKPQSIAPPPGPEKPPPKAPLPWEIYQMCLLIEGKQHRATSGIAAVVGGETCHVEKPDWVAVVPSWWETLLLVPVWGPDPGPEEILESAIVGHINVRVQGQAANANSASIIHFPDLQSAPPLPVLGEALLRSKHKDSSVPVVVVLPRGSFQDAKSVVEKKLGTFPRELQSPLAITEDYEESWSRAFEPTDGSATYLLSGQGKLVWKSTGPLDSASFASALDEHATAGLHRRSRMLHLAVRSGEPAPDLNFGSGQSAGPSLSRLRGQHVLLLFWKSCSRPCLVELRRMQHVHKQRERTDIVVIAIADGEDAQRTAEIGREHKLGFTLIPDPERRFSRQYGVNCWPTIVSINEHGLVDFVHSGITHERPAAGDRPETNWSSLLQKRLIRIRAGRSSATNRLSPGTLLAQPSVL